MLLLIKNEPKAYAWGSKEALPEILRVEPTGQPQAELWLGDHHGAPAKLAIPGREETTLIDLISSDPQNYGVKGGSLPFLMKVLGIGAPLSIQVHPNLEQARLGFLAEESAGIDISDPERSYKDSNHKPELLVALSRVRALAGFRPVSEFIAELNAVAGAAGTCGAPGAQALFALAVKTAGLARSETPEKVRENMLDWIFSETAEGAESVAEAVDAVERVFKRDSLMGVRAERFEMMREIIDNYPADPGILMAMMLRMEILEPGEAIFVAAGEPHAYLSGLGVEIMSSSDNVLRAGLTPKHKNIPELRRVIVVSDSAEPRVDPIPVAPGLVQWKPEIADFTLFRATLRQPDAAFEKSLEGAAEEVRVEANWPLVLIVTAGRVRIERQEGQAFEVASVRQGQSMYVSAGKEIVLTGQGQVFIATVGETFS